MFILQVEDNESDILLTRIALEEAGIDFQLTALHDGKEAIRFLNREGNHEMAKLPDLILLDINLPKKNGHEVLKYIKEHKDLKQIPVVMMTTSSSQKDITMALANHADGFITKPPDVEEFLNIVALTVNAWILKIGQPG